MEAAFGKDEGDGDAEAALGDTVEVDYKTESGQIRSKTYTVIVFSDIGDQLFTDFLRYALFCRCKGSNGAVFFVGYIV